MYFVTSTIELQTRVVYSLVTAQGSFLLAQRASRVVPRDVSYAYEVF